MFPAPKKFKSEYFHLQQICIQTWTYIWQFQNFITILVNFKRGSKVENGASFWVVFVIFSLIFLTHKKIKNLYFSLDQSIFIRISTYMEQFPKFISLLANFKRWSKAKNGTNLLSNITRPQEAITNEIENFNWFEDQSRDQDILTYTGRNTDDVCIIYGALAIMCKKKLENPEKNIFKTRFYRPITF